jgi:hypothetical protein
MAGRSRARISGGGGGGLLSLLMNLYGGNVEAVTDTSKSEKALDKAGIEGPPEAEVRFKAKNPLARGRAADLNAELAMGNIESTRALAQQKELEAFTRQLMHDYGLETKLKGGKIDIDLKEEELRRLSDLQAAAEGKKTGANQKAITESLIDRQKTLEPLVRENAWLSGLDQNALGYFSANNLIADNTTRDNLLKTVTPEDLARLGVQAAAHRKNVELSAEIAEKNRPTLLDIGVGEANLKKQGLDYNITNFGKLKGIEEAGARLRNELTAAQIDMAPLGILSQGNALINRSTQDVLATNPRDIDPEKAAKAKIYESIASEFGIKDSNKPYVSQQSGKTDAVVQPSAEERKQLQQAAPSPGLIFTESTTGKKFKLVDGRKVYIQ